MCCACSALLVLPGVPRGLADRGLLNPDGVRDGTVSADARARTGPALLFKVRCLIIPELRLALAATASPAPPVEAAAREPLIFSGDQSACCLCAEKYSRFSDR